MSNPNEMAWRAFAAWLTYIVVVGGGMLLYLLSGDSKVDGLGAWIAWALIIGVTLKLLWSSLGPLCFLMWGANWQAFEDARQAQHDEMRRERRRRR